ncbi:membrane progestin receptor epsilon-like [Clavelina lepadiformis]|uniref:membrane progestin receptor epsilon-like n=1 Tax=Clavelina lepadiformis TaxID=159417 RepID=UPI004042B836
MPDHMCPNKYIVHGYRPSPSSWNYCLKSLFYPTNETLNVWSHAIPLFAMAKHYWNFACLYPDYLTSPIFYPYWVFVVGVVAVFSGSCFAHLFQCKSPAFFNACFCYDYAGIAIYGAGTAVAVGLYLCPYSCTGLSPDSSSWIFDVVVVVHPLAVVCLCLSLYPGVPTTLSYILRIITCIVYVLVAFLPCFYKYTLVPDSASAMQCRLGNDVASIITFAIMIICFIISALLQGTKYPESFYPGKFDIIGHSHQIFHLLFAIVVFLQTLLIEWSLTEWIVLLQTGLIQPETLQITLFKAVVIPTISALLSGAAGIRYSNDLRRLKCHTKAE